MGDVLNVSKSHLEPSHGATHRSDPHAGPAVTQRDPSTSGPHVWPPGIHSAPRLNDKMLQGPGRGPIEGREPWGQVRNEPHVVWWCQ